MGFGENRDGRSCVDEAHPTEPYSNRILQQQLIQCRNLPDLGAVVLASGPYRVEQELTTEK